MFAIGPPPELGLIVVFAGFGGYLGAAVAEWSDHRFARPTESSAIVRRWSLLGPAVGLFSVVAARW